jgi:excisionase family DNA binding protein
VEHETTENREPPRLLLPAEAGRRLGVDVTTLANWHRAGKITATRTIGGHRRYPEAEVAALAASV